MVWVETILGLNGVISSSQETTQPEGIGPHPPLPRKAELLRSQIIWGSLRNLIAKTGLDFVLAKV